MQALEVLEAVEKSTLAKKEKEVITDDSTAPIINNNNENNNKDNKKQPLLKIKVPVRGNSAKNKNTTL